VVAGREFDQAVCSALRHDAIGIVAWSVDRFIRSIAWRPFPAWRRVAPARYDLARLVLVSEKIPLLTITNPDEEPDTAHGRNVRRGHRVSGRVGGRPRNERPSERLKRLLDRVIEMRHGGASYREIEQATGVPHKTAQRWCKLYWTDERSGGMSWGRV